MSVMFWLFWAVATVVLVAVAEADRQLLLVTVVFRHGDRTPIESYPTDPHKDPNNWPDGFGQLTAKGKLMQYNLGRYLRQRYSSILSTEYSLEDVYVRSTDVDRTLMSAQSNLAGLYPPVGDQVWNPSLAWQPIPVHTVPPKEDSLLGSNPECPKYTKLYDELMASDEIRKIDARFKWLYDYLTEHTGKVVRGLRSMDHLHDTLYIERLHNKTLPEWTARVFPHPTEKLMNLGFALSTFTPELKRLKGGPLVKYIVDEAKSVSQLVMENNGSSHRKLVMFSGHDTTLANFLNALGMFDPPIAPPSASCIMVELYHNNDSKLCEIRMLFRNQTDHEPFLLNVHGCGEFCPVSAFANLTRDVYPEDWSRECRLEGGDALATAVSYVAFVTVGALLLCLVVAVFVAFRRRSLISRLDGREYRYLSS